jgi:hypothetical protein
MKHNKKITWRWRKECWLWPWDMYGRGHSQRIIYCEGGLREYLSYLLLPNLMSPSSSSNGIKEGPQFMDGDISFIFANFPISIGHTNSYYFSHYILTLPLCLAISVSLFLGLSTFPLCQIVTHQKFSFYFFDSPEI